MRKTTRLVEELVGEAENEKPRTTLRAFQAVANQLERVIDSVNSLESAETHPEVKSTLRAFASTLYSASKKSNVEGSIYYYTVGKGSTSD